MGGARRKNSERIRRKTEIRMNFLLVPKMGQSVPYRVEDNVIYFHARQKKHSEVQNILDLSVR